MLIVVYKVFKWLWISCIDFLASLHIQEPHFCHSPSLETNGTGSWNTEETSSGGNRDSRPGLKYMSWDNRRGENHRSWSPRQRGQCDGSSIISVGGIQPYGWQFRQGFHQKNKELFICKCKEVEWFQHGFHYRNNELEGIPYWSSG